MRKLPYIIDTYKNTFILYSKTFLNVLPLLILHALIVHFFTDSISGDLNSSPKEITRYEYLVISGKTLVYYALSCLIYCFITVLMLQKHFQQPYDYLTAF